MRGSSSGDTASLNRRQAAAAQPTELTHSAQKPAAQQRDWWLARRPPRRAGGAGGCCAPALPGGGLDAPRREHLLPRAAISQVELPHAAAVWEGREALADRVEHRGKRGPVRGSNSGREEGRAAASAGWFCVMFLLQSGETAARERAGEGVRGSVPAPLGGLGLGRPAPRRPRRRSSRCTSAAAASSLLGRRHRPRFRRRDRRVPQQRRRLGFARGHEGLVGALCAVDGRREGLGALLCRARVKR